MKRITLFFLLAFPFVKIYGQMKDSIASLPATKDSVYLWSPEKQFFKLGDFTSFIGDKIIYPQTAQKNRIEGRVIVQFVIEKDGTVSNIKTVKGIGSGCDEEVERIIALTNGLWSPGKYKGEPIRLKMMQPVFFKLPPTKKK